MSDDLDALLESMNQRINEAVTNPNAVGLCGRCKKDIVSKEKMVQALKNTFHLTCWTCCRCNKPLQDENFYYDDPAKPHCQDCYQKTLPICNHCNSLIEGEYLTACEKQYHPNHLMCVQCGQPLSSGRFYPKNDKPHCEKCVAQG